MFYLVKRKLGAGIATVADAQLLPPGARAGSWVDRRPYARNWSSTGTRSQPTRPNLGVK
jgi:hypothetical protein